MPALLEPRVQLGGAYDANCEDRTALHQRLAMERVLLTRLSNVRNFEDRKHLMSITVRFAFVIVMLLGIIIVMLERQMSSLPADVH